MTVTRRFESRLWLLNLFEKFSRQPSFTRLIIKTLTTKFSKLGFLKCGLIFWPGDFTFYEIKPKLSKSEQKSYISSNIGSMKKTDHILELPRTIGVFFTINPRMLLLIFGLQINAVNYFKDQRQPLNRLSTLMFRGTPRITLNWDVFSALWYLQMSLYFQSFCFKYC